MKLLFVIYFMLFCAVACSGGSNSWNGSVDAVFRYRPSESSTVVHEVRKGSLSEESGLKVGDQILEIDGEDVANADFQVVRDALRGPVGTLAHLTVRRGSSIVSLSVERRPAAKK